MKLLRIWLLVLLAVVLPVRGGMAATMPCAPAGSSHHPAQAEEALHHGSAHMDHGVGHAHPGTAHVGASTDQGKGGHDHSGGGHDHSTGDKCNVCSASCSSLPLPSAGAAIGAPVVLASVSFPDLFAPAPTFQSDGQERPPRTI